MPFRHEITWVRVLGNNVLVDLVDRGDNLTPGGIIIPDDDGKESGLRPRWAEVLASGPEARLDGIEPGDRVLIEQLSWSRKLMDATYDDGSKRPVWLTHSDKCLLIEKLGSAE